MYVGWLLGEGIVEDRFCGYCGQELRQDGSFCPSCGKPTTRDAQVPTPLAVAWFVLQFTVGFLNGLLGGLGG